MANLVGCWTWAAQWPDGGGRRSAEQAPEGWGSTGRGFRSALAEGLPKSRLRSQGVGEGRGEEARTAAKGRLLRTLSGCIHRGECYATVACAILLDDQSGGGGGSRSPVKGETHDTDFSGEIATEFL